MAQFVVRNLEDDVHARLRVLASEQGQSMEEFVREVLRSIALEHGQRRSPLGTRVASRFARIGLKKTEDISEFNGQSIAPPEFDR
jgi:plasmid stability protein